MPGLMGSALELEPGLPGEVPRPLPHDSGELEGEGGESEAGGPGSLPGSEVEPGESEGRKGIKRSWNE